MPARTVVVLAGRQLLEADLLVEGDRRFVAVVHLQDDGPHAQVTEQPQAGLDQFGTDASAPMARRHDQAVQIGQLADYSRLLDPQPDRAVLMPERPRRDLLALAESQGLTVVWPENGEFARV